eukprot:TRINITY_DN6517_c0_g1_i4.p1 TRINITY_DN6517_c0_g1~~TRINITY_DN6517_c0_g1_i4.p1  ORF type:complete len:466 (+),score=87.10 TRINITY_DN6517_c0_g1_i4:125-1522(+)
MARRLTAPVASTVIHRHRSEEMQVGIAEANGWRVNFEDEHAAVVRDAQGFIGVFDGHGGNMCSRFIARRMAEEVEKEVPQDEAAIRALALRLDSEFLATRQASGSCGTFVFAEKGGGSSSSTCRLRVGNVGDSRVILGNYDGTMTRGAGTEGALTTDHTPEDAQEAKRIKNAGGSANFVRGSFRVNGQLAVSRAFGNACLKAGPERRMVIAEPDVVSMECSTDSFLILVCDGVLGGGFSNESLVRFVADRFREGSDAGAVACTVVQAALQQGARDNLTCAVLTFDAPASSLPKREVAFFPGPMYEPRSEAFQKAYAGIAKKAGVTLAEAAERRYDDLQAELEAQEQVASFSNFLTRRTLKNELAVFERAGKPPAQRSDDSVSATVARTTWFAEYLEWCVGHTTAKPTVKATDALQHFVKGDAIAAKVTCRKLVKTSQLPTWVKRVARWRAFRCVGLDDATPLTLR